ncbi:hypothetical protein [Paraburkholderia bonniea]|uniref:hypothetical protein n=1 Tax=Paraburkholderia bonniea TaxID=2152891 RepID=UPI001291A3F4|nr:hypothetical protein [Paraburkholderia bonniea]
MKMEIGVIAIAIIVLLVTFFVFGRNVKNTFEAEFFYWLKSTLVMAPLLFGWIVYNEPAILNLTGILISVGLAAAFTLGRSYLIAML